MISHEGHDHPATKVARAACRRHQEATLESSVARHPSANKKARSGRLPSMIAPKLRPLIDAAKAKGLRVHLSTEMPDGVDQAFVIMHPRKPDCELIAEAFRAASKGREGRAEFFHVEGGRSRQLSRARAMADLDRLASA